MGTPGMQLQVSHDVDWEEWQTVADGCPYATFFHTPSWLRVFAQTYPGVRIATRRFQFEDGRSAIFPLLERRVRAGLTTLYESTAEGCYGGWISSDDLPTEDIGGMCQWILTNCRSLVWRTNPLNQVARLSDLSSEADTTEILPLTDFDDEESLLRNYKHSVRKQINKAKRANLHVRPAETWSHWEAYLRIYESAVERWGKKAYIHYPPKLFRSLFDLGSSRVKLWLVTANDEIVGGNLNFYQGRHAVEWHAAFDAKSFALGARNFLVHNIILDARSAGYAYYDFNPSGPLEGARRFKQTFGTKSLPAHVIVRKHGLLRLTLPRGLVRALRKMSGRR